MVSTDLDAFDRRLKVPATRPSSCYYYYCCYCYCYYYCCYCYYYYCCCCCYYYY